MSPNSVKFIRVLAKFLIFICIAIAGATTFAYFLQKMIEDNQIALKRQHENRKIRPILNEIPANSLNN